MTLPILKHFTYAHLPPKLQQISAPFHILADQLATTLKPGAELSTALRKLLESKDAAVRAAIDSGMLDRQLVREPAPDAPRDPVTGHPLPAGSPYSMAHTPTRAAGEPVTEGSAAAMRDIPHRNTVRTQAAQDRHEGASALLLAGKELPYDPYGSDD
jgi:hypothetical protein